MMHCRGMRSRCRGLVGPGGFDLIGYASRPDQVTLNWSLGLGLVKPQRSGAKLGRWRGDTGFEAGAGNAFSTTLPQTKHDQRACLTAGRLLGYKCVCGGGSGPALGLARAVLQAQLAGPSGSCARPRREPHAARRAWPTPRPSRRRMAPGKGCLAASRIARTAIDSLARKSSGRAGVRASQWVWFSQAPLPQLPCHPTAASKGSHALIFACACLSDTTLLAF
jgi:hypothetical protein